MVFAEAKSWHWGACILVCVATSGCLNVPLPGSDEESSEPRSSGTASDDSEYIDTGESSVSTAQKSKSKSTAPAAPSSTSGTSTPAPSSKPTTPRADVVTFSIDGRAASVEGTDVWVNASGPGQYDLFITLTTLGTSKTDLVIHTTRVGSGCTGSTNMVTYRPAGDTQFMTSSTSEASCGLTISELPTSTTGRFRGSFKGTLRSINTYPTRTKAFDITFDVARDD